LPKNSPVSGKLLLPDPLAQYYDLVLSWLALFRQEGASKPRLDSHDREQVACYESTDDLLRLSASHQNGFVVIPQRITGHVLESRVLLPPILVVRIRCREFRYVLLSLVDEHEATGISKRQSSQQDRVDDAEQRHVSADSNRQCQYCDGGQPRIPSEEPETMTQIGRDGTHR